MWYFPKQKVGNIYNAKYQDTYGNKNYVVSASYIIDTIIWRFYSGIKQTATGSVYLQSSTYLDAEGSSHLRSCLCDAIINASPRIGQITDKF